MTDTAVGKRVVPSVVAPSSARPKQEERFLLDLAQGRFERAWFDIDVFTPIELQNLPPSSVPSVLQLAGMPSGSYRELDKVTSRLTHVEHISISASIDCPTDLLDLCAGLAAMPQLKSLRAIFPLKRNAHVTLFASQVMSKLTNLLHLDVSGCKFSAGFLEQLAPGLVRMRNLRILVCYDFLQSEAENFATLVLPQLRKLRHLRFRMDVNTSERLLQAGSRYMRGLRSLQMHPRIDANRDVPLLRHMHVLDFPVSSASWELLASDPTILSQLRVFAGQTLKPSDEKMMKLIGTALSKATELRELDVDPLQPVSGSLSVFFRAAGDVFGKLESLNISAEALNPDSLDVVCDAIKSDNSRLRALELGYRDSKFINAILAVTPNLEKLSLASSATEGDTVPITDFSELAKLTKLVDLDISYSQISDDAMVEFATKVMPNLLALEKLDVSGSPITKRGAKALVESLKHAASTLRMLDMSLCNLGDAMGAAVVAACAQFPEMRHLELGSNNVGALTCEQIARWMRIRSVMHGSACPPSLHLGLRSNVITPASLRVMLRNGMPRVHMLTLQDNLLRAQLTMSDGDEAYSLVGGVQIQHHGTLFTTSSCGDAGCITLLDQMLTHFPIRSLDLSDGDLDEHWFKEMAAWPQHRFRRLKDITRMTMEDVDFSNAESLKIFATKALPYMKSLVSLNLRDTYITGEGMRAFARQIGQAQRLASLTITSASVATAVDFSGFANLEILELSSSTFSDDAIAGLAQALPLMKQLRELDISSLNINADRAITLAPALKQVEMLEVLNISSNYMYSRGAEEVLRNLPMGLTDLNMTSCEGGWAAAVEFMQKMAVEHPKMTSVLLGVPRCTITVNVAKSDLEFSGSLMERHAHFVPEVMRSLPKTRRLMMSGLYMRLAHITRIAPELRSLPELVFLDLSDNELDNDAVLVLAREGLTFLPKLEKLVLSSNRFSETGVRAIVREAMVTGKLSKLRELDMSYSSIGVGGATDLAGALNKMPDLRTIRASGADEAAGPLVAAMHSQKRDYDEISVGGVRVCFDLVSLSQGGSFGAVQARAVGDPGIESIVKSVLPAISTSHIAVLALNEAGISDEGAAVFSPALALLPKLLHLDLRQNTMSLEGMQALVKNGFKHIKQLQTLHVGSNDFEDDSAVLFGKEAMPLLTELTYLGMDENELGDDGTAAIMSNITARIVTLSMSSCGIKDAGAAAIAKELPRLQHLSRCILDGNGFSLEAGAKILQAVHQAQLRQVEHVDLDSGPSGGFSYMNYGHDLRVVQVGDTGCRTITEQVFPCIDMLCNLDMTEAGVEKAVGEGLADAVAKLKHLSTISFEGSAIGADGIVSMIKALVKTPCVTADFEDTLDNEGGIQLRHKFTNMMCMRLGDKVGVLTKIMPLVPDVRSLLLSNNALRAAEADQLCDALRSTTSLEYVQLGNNDGLDKAGVSKVVSCLSERSWTRNLAQVNLTRTKVPPAKRRGLEFAMRGSGTEIIFDPVRVVSFVSRWFTRASLLNQVADLASDVLLLVLVLCSCAFPRLGIEPVVGVTPFVTYAAGFALLCALLIGLVPFLRGPDQLLALVDGRSKSVFTYKLLALFEGSIELLVLYALRFNRQFGAFDFFFIGLSVLLLVLDFSYVRLELYDQMQRKASARRQAITLLESIWVAIVIVVALTTLSRYATHLSLLPYAMVGVSLVIAAFVMMLLVAADEPNSEFSALGIVADGKYFAHPILAWMYQATAAPLVMPLAWLVFKRRQAAAQRAMEEAANKRRGSADDDALPSGPVAVLAVSEQAAERVVRAMGPGAVVRQNSLQGAVLLQRQASKGAMVQQASSGGKEVLRLLEKQNTLTQLRSFAQDESGHGSAAAATRDSDDDDGSDDDGAGVGSIASAGTKKKQKKLKNAAAEVMSQKNRGKGAAADFAAIVSAKQSAMKMKERQQRHKAASPKRGKDGGGGAGAASSPHARKRAQRKTSDPDRMT